MRRRDPVMQREASKSLSRQCASDAPYLNSEPGDLVLVAPQTNAHQAIPSHDERQRILATEPFAFVDGFRMLVLFAFGR